MHTLTDPVTTKINELSFLLEKLQDDLKLECAEASLSGNFSSVISFITTSKDIQSFSSKVEQLGNQWKTGIASSTSKKKSKIYEKTNRNNTKKKADDSNLIVYLGGNRVDGETPTDIFINVLKHIGLEKISHKNITLCKYPLVSTIRSTSYQNQKKSGEWYIVTHASTTTKIEILQKVGKLFDIDINIQRKDLQKKP